MATYAAYRHIELDKVGYSKKRVRNPQSEIMNVMSTPPTPSSRSAVDGTPRRRSSSTADSFNRLFGDSPSVITPRRASLSKHDVTNRNPVTGDGVQSWDSRPSNRHTPNKVHTERNPVTGEINKVVSPVSTPKKAMSNGFTKIAVAVTNGNAELPSGPVTNGQA